MDSKLKEYLKDNNISYSIYRHPASFTVQESKKLVKNVPGVHTKNLFLKDEKGRFYLICIEAEKRINTNFLKRRLEVKELNFGSKEELKSELNTTPGSVSIFGAIYAKSTHLIIDKDIWEAEQSGFHPNINTSTLVLDHQNLEKFCNSLKINKEIIKLG